MAAKVAPSVMRSQVASSVAPKRVPPPRNRAMVPSIMSKVANSPESTAAHARCPAGMSVTTMTVVSTAPRIVNPMAEPSPRMMPAMKCIR